MLQNNLRRKDPKFVLYLADITYLVVGNAFPVGGRWSRRAIPVYLCFIPVFVYAHST